MNKYEEVWNKIEGNNLENLNFKYSLKFYKYTLKKYGLKETKYYFDMMRFQVPYLMLACFTLFPQDLKTWIKNNILNELNEEKVINTYIHSINNTITQKKEKYTVLYINSFNNLGIIKHIEVINDTINITLKNNEIIKINKLLKDNDEISLYSNKCHQVCYEKLLLDKEDKLYVVSVIENDLYNREIFHSFIVKDEIVYDYSRNILMNYNDYINIFKPKVVMYMKNSNILNEITRLESVDKDFNKLNKWNPVLKYVLYNLKNTK